MSKPIPNARPAFYATLLPLLAEVAREHGYSIAVHGSMLRDFDLVAVPWACEAQPAEMLAEAIRDAMGGFWKSNDRNGSRVQKPHGRRCWSIHLAGSGCYVDLSVMPRAGEIEAHINQLVDRWAEQPDRAAAATELLLWMYGADDRANPPPDPT